MIRLAAPVRPQPTAVPQTDEQIILTKSDLKDIFQSFAEALTGMLGHTVPKEALTKLTDNVVEKAMQKKKKPTTTTPVATRHQQPRHHQPPPQPQAPGTTPATAAIEAEKKALGLKTTRTETKQTNATHQTTHAQTEQTTQHTSRANSDYFSGTSVDFAESSIC